MKRTVVCFIVGMIGVVQCFFCMAEESAAKRGTGLWGFNEESCKTIQGLIGDTGAHDIEKLCAQSPEQLAAEIAIMQVVLLKKQLERHQNLLQRNNLALDISPGKIRELAQTMYLTRGGANEEKSPHEQGLIDGKYWYNQKKISRFLEWMAALDIYVKYYCGSYLYDKDYRNGVYNGAADGYFEWVL